MRGAGRRRIFEDDRDRRYFVEGLRELVEKDRVELLAWCLMDNHVHMLAKADLLSKYAIDASTPDDQSIAGEEMDGYEQITWISLLFPAGVLQSV